MLFKLPQLSQSLSTFCSHASVFTGQCNNYCPLSGFHRSELLSNSCSVGSDLLGAVMLFGSSLMWPSSSMWTRVALSVTTPFPLQTLLGSKPENIDCHLSSTRISYTQSCLLLPSIVTSESGHRKKKKSYHHVQLITTMTHSEREVEH